MKLIKLISLMVTAMLLIGFALGCSGDQTAIEKSGTEAGSTDESVMEEKDDEAMEEKDAEEMKDDADKNSSESFTPKTFDNLKSPHYVSSAPVNNSVSSAVIDKVSIMFNFDLAPNSKIEVTKNGSSVTAGATVVAGDKLSISVPINGNETGNYSVNYVACWPDKSCHDGSFGFSIDLP